MRAVLIEQLFFVLLINLYINLLLPRAQGVFLLLSIGLRFPVSCSWELTTAWGRLKRALILQKSDLIKENRLGCILFPSLVLYTSVWTISTWKCRKSTVTFLATSSINHRGVRTVCALLVLAFMSKQCFFSVWSCVFCTQCSPVPSGLIHHGPSPLLCPIRIRAAISVLYLWRDAPCIASSAKFH